MNLSLEFLMNMQCNWILAADIKHNYVIFLSAIT